MRSRLQLQCHKLGLQNWSYIIHHPTQRAIQLAPCATLQQAELSMNQGTKKIIGCVPSRLLLFLNLKLKQINAPEARNACGVPTSLLICPLHLVVVMFCVCNFLCCSVLFCAE